MPDMHAVYRFSCVLAGTPLAGYQVHNIFRLACKVVSDSVRQASVATPELLAFHQSWAEHASPPPATMVVLETASWPLLQITAI